MKKFLKENWFVAVIALFFVSISIYYAYDQNKDNLPAKTVNGKDVVATVDDVVFTADDLYDTMYKTYGKNQLFLAFCFTNSKLLSKLLWLWYRIS